MSYGTAKARTGDLQTNAQQSREAVALADESNDKLWQLGSRINLAFACLLLGELREASQIVDEVLARFDSARLDRPSAPASVLYMMALRCRAHLDLAFGRPLSDAEQGYQTLLSLAQRAGSKEEEFEALAGLSSVALERGDADAAVENATHGVTVADRLQSPRFLSVSLCQLGRALCFNADWAAASRALEEALRIVRDEFGGGAGSEAGIVTALAEVHLGRGDIDQARELAAEAASIAHGQKHPMAESTAELLKGRIALSSEGPEAIALAESALQRASTLLERAGAAMARLHEAWAELSGARQHGPEQVQHLREAHRLYTEMGATGHAQRVARELSPAS